MSTCPKEKLELFDIELGIAIILGIVIGYLPQIFKIIRKKDSYGISPYARLICFVSQTFLLFNVILLQKNSFRCTIIGEYDILYALGILLGFHQIFIQWICVTTIEVLFIVFYPRHNIKNITIGEKQRERYKKEWRATVISIYVSIISFLLFLSISAISIIFKFKENVINHIAGLFGIASAFLAVFQYLPQIVKTYRDKAPGAVSILTLLIQVPGALVMGICLIIQPGTNWTSSASYFVSFLLNGTVLVLCIYYTFKIRRMNKQNKDETDSNEKSEEEQFLEKVVTE